MERQGNRRMILLQEKRSFIQQQQAIKDQVARLNHFERNLDSTEAGRVKTAANSLYAKVYTGSPFLLQTLSHWTGYSDELERARQFFESLPPAVQPSLTKTREAVEKNIACNPFIFKVNGTSLQDISAMPLPLGSHDIKRIDSILKSRTVTGQSAFVRDAILLAAAQAEINRTVNISPAARQLVQKIKNYWEYYTAWALNTDESCGFLIRALWGGYLPHGLLTFIPARLHISPSSVFRLFDGQVESVSPAILARTVRRSKLLPFITSFLTTMPAPKGLPLETLPYLSTDAKKEEAIKKKLQEGYKERSKGKNEIKSLEQKTLGLIESFSAQHRRYIRQIVRNPEGLIRISPSADSYFEEILAGCYYGKTLTITGLAENGNIGVSLDIVQNGQIFGIPPRLLKNAPVAAHLLVEDFLKPIIKEAAAAICPAGNGIFLPDPVLSADAVKETPVSRKRSALKNLQFVTRRTSRPKLPVETLPAEEDEKDPYLPIHKGRLIEGSLTTLSEKFAEELIPNEKRLPYDIQLILEALCQDPYGPGTYKITNALPVAENGRKMPLRSFRADIRRLPFQYKEYSGKLRTVYYIDDKARSVVIVETMTHKRFDDIYTQR